MTQHIESLQEQINGLFANINDLYQQRTETQSQENVYDREPSHSLPVPQSGLDSQRTSSPAPPSNYPRFHGPTSSAFNFNVAKSSLQTMGIAPVEDSAQELFTTRDPSPSPTENTTQQLPSIPEMSAHPSKDPIWLVKRDDAIRLCHVYEEEIGIMYPMLELNQVLSQANLLFTFLEAADRTGFARRFEAGADCLADDNTSILKFVLAITLTLESNGPCSLGNRLFVCAKQKIEGRLWGPADLKSIKLFALIVRISSIYFIRSKFRVILTTAHRRRIIFIPAMT